MNIALINFFPFRPHIEHMFYLGAQLEKAGHKVSFLRCDKLLSSCYYKEINSYSKLSCVKCKLGGFGQYNNIDLHSLNRSNEDSPFDVKEFVKSSVYTLNREEDSEKINSDSLNLLSKRLQVGAQESYSSVTKFLKENDIDFSFIFNGRIDVMRAALESCKNLKINFACVERTWFGDGIQLNFLDNCLSLKDLKKLSFKYSDIPLTNKEAELAATALFKRIKGVGNNEWRQYNKNPKVIDWSSKARLKVLILPSSKNEQLSHKDWTNNFNDFHQYFDNVIDALKLKYNDLSVNVRGHPNWSETIYGVEGEQINLSYMKWAKSKNYNYISSDNSASTFDLISNCDLLLLNGSSAVYEAGYLGKASIVIGKCHYDRAQIAHPVYSESCIDKINFEALLNRNKDEIVRNTLRFVFSFAFRYALFKESVQAINTLDYKYSANFDVDRLEKMISQLEIIPDSDELEDFEANFSNEMEVVDAVLSGYKFNNTYQSKIVDEFSVKVKPLNKVVNMLRNYLPRGDL